MSRRRTRRNRTFPRTTHTQPTFFTITPADLVDRFQEGRRAHG